MNILQSKYLPRIVNWIIVISFVISNFSHHYWERNRVIEWDVKSYYAYLPAAFIYKDLSLEYRQHNLDKFGDLIWPVETPTGKQAIVTSMGMSILYSPFFFIAHGVAKVSPQYEADGYSVPYKFALSFSAMFYVALGLYFLRRLIMRYFNPLVTAITIIAVVVGTNLYYYTCWGSPMPHAYNFTLITIFFFYVIRWYENPSRYKAIGLGLLSGLITLIRPTNILILLLLFLWDVKSWYDLKERVLFYIKRWDYVGTMLVFFLLAWLPQLIYWKYISGKFMYFSYGELDASFFFNNPQIYNILFSYKKGWLVYTPIMTFGLIGLGICFKKMKEAFIPITVYALAMIYVLSSWWCWWYGGSFGLRAFVDMYGVMAVPMAVLVNQSLKKKYLLYSVIPVMALLTWYNTFQIKQFKSGAIHYWWMSKEAYWENFLKRKPTDKSRELFLMPDYEKARKGIYKALTPKEFAEIESQKQQAKRTFSDEQLLSALKDSLKNDPVVVDSLQTVAHQSQVSLDSLLTLHANSIMNTSNNAPLMKELKLNIIEKEIRSNDKHLENIRKKASVKKISIDSMITLDAIWLYKHNVKQDDKP